MRLDQRAVPSVADCEGGVIVDLTRTGIADGTHSIGTAIGQGDIDCVKIMQELRAHAPDALDTIVFEIELPLNGRPIEEGRELELQTAKESINYMRQVLRIGKAGKVPDQVPDRSGTSISRRATNPLSRSASRTSDASFESSGSRRF